MVRSPVATQHRTTFVARPGHIRLRTGMRLQRLEDEHSLADARWVVVL